MHSYIHKVNYYETDKMGITHHSNYVRWMEEARMDYLKSVGYSMRRLESDNITSPVVSVKVKYEKTTTFDDEVRVDTFVEKYTGVRLEMSYVMINLTTGEEAARGKSAHCFIDSSGRPIAVKKYFPDFDRILTELAEERKKGL